jgi:hypothetical protein
MPPRIGVLLTHGMGDPQPDFADDVIDRLRGRLGKRAGDVAFEPCYWAPILQRSQDRVWGKLVAGGRKMDQKRARRWIVSALGDPVGYLSGYLQAGEPVHGKVHECMRDALARLASRLAEPDAAPLVVLAHSLGSVVASNYIWNEERASGELRPASAGTLTGALGATKREPVGRTPFERMETLVTLVTYGSTIPLFLPPVEPLECIRFPRESLPPKLRAVARWLNVYDPDDLLGYPIAAAWDELHGTRIDDVTVNVGPFPLSETPFIHTRYDRDGGFLDLVVREVRKVAEALDADRPPVA